MLAIRPAFSSSLLAVGAWLSLAGEAAAHIDLASPEPREHGRSASPNANLKQGPCGQLENGRTSRVNVFAPGETIQVVWAETTNHPSYYRIAFDRDGDDAFPVFAGSGIGADDVDPTVLCPVDGQVILAYEMNDGAGGTHSLSVTLPDVECERCTLQVIQFMYDTRRSYYFQCADLALRRPERDAGTAALDGGLDASATPAPDPSPAPACWSRLAPDAGPLRADSDDDDDDDDDPRPPPSGPSGTPAAEHGPPRAPEPDTPPRRGRSRGGCTLEQRAASTAPAPASLLGGFWLVTLVARRVARRRRCGSASTTRRG